MVIVFLLFLCIQTLNSQTTTPNLLYNCSLSSDTYIINAAVFDQFQFDNYTSIRLTASYAFISSSLLSSSTFELGLIYQFSSYNNLVPFPIIFNCASMVHSCQLKTLTSKTMMSRDSEPITAHLTSVNYSSKKLNKQFKQMSLYLKQGRYQLSNCSLNNGQHMTDPQTIFNIQIQYEKSVGSSCDPIKDTCGSSSLVTCSSSVCTCNASPSARVSYYDSFYCADMASTSECKIFPSRCIVWCNATTNYLCVCPIGTLKVQRNNIFICELPINSNNCTDDQNDVRRCSYGQCCFNEQCMDCSMTSTTSKSIKISESSIDDRLRIVLGVVAGILGTSVIILLSVFCWLRQRQRRRRQSAEKSLTPSTNSSTSSLYISPYQRQETLPSSMSTIYQVPYNDETRNKIIFYRADSFRQAVQSGSREKKIFEHVSAKRDSYIQDKEGWSSPTFSSLEYIIPSKNHKDHLSDSYKNKNDNMNIYQIVVPSSTNYTHIV